ncbi:MAG TPA: nuclear transport factor 2 family protein [Candidatus Acidoferrales bacterium]|nr:nuclear transport factor 2 family protein [Candidatus Acidoferrales bacterium]
MTPTPGSIGDQVVAAIAAQDRDALARCFAPECRFRALIPDGLREREGRDPTADLITRWFADTTDLQLLDSHADELADRLHIWYRITGVENSEPYVVEQHLFGVVRDGAIASAQLLCSGFRPQR